jgi:hypothetical protein
MTTAATLRHTATAAAIEKSAIHIEPPPHVETGVSDARKPPIHRSKNASYAMGVPMELAGSGVLDREKMPSRLNVRYSGIGRSI